MDGVNERAVDSDINNILSVEKILKNHNFILREKIAEGSFGQIYKLENIFVNCSFCC